MRIISVLSLLLFVLGVYGKDWSFTVYTNAAYGGTSKSYSGTDVGVSCYNLPTSVNNKVSSFKYWTSGAIGSCCSIKMYDGQDCAGTKIGSTTDDWNVPQISSVNNDRMSSFRISCNLGCGG